MLRVTSSKRSAMCDGIGRRDFLRIGALGLGGLTLADLFRASAFGGESGSYLHDKSVVFLFLAGGPSQYETFDPKPDGLEGHTSIAGHIPTSLPGVRFASYLPKLAKQAHRLSIVKSFQTNHSEHNGAHKQLLTADLTVKDGQPIREPGLGAVCTRASGVTNPLTGVPRHVLIPPTVRYPGAGKGFAGAFESVVEGTQAAHLGPDYEPLEVLVPMAGGKAEQKKKKNEPDTPDPYLDSLEPRLDANVLGDRLSLVQQLDSLGRRLDIAAGRPMDAYRQRALDMLRGGQVRNAFDLSLEDPSTLRAYDTEHFRNWQCDDDSKFMRDQPSIGFSLGRQLLLARRLCEAGAGFVTVVNANWDFHARKGIPNMPEGMGAFGPPLDHAVSAFIEDIHQRGLDKKILLVITGEFGRTKLDKNAGRHHHPGICPLVFAGGGLNHGQVIGRSDERGARPDDNPITIDDLHATILHTLFDVGQMRLDPSLPRKVISRIENGRPIEALF